MAAGDTSRATKTDLAPAHDRDRKLQRDNGPRPPSGPSNASVQPQVETSGGSLRSRISEQEPRSAAPSPINSHRPEASHKDDDRDGGRKRTASGKLLLSAMYSDVDFIFHQNEKEKQVTKQPVPVRIKQRNLPKGHGLIEIDINPRRTVILMPLQRNCYQQTPKQVKKLVLAERIDILACDSYLSYRRGCVCIAPV